MLFDNHIKLHTSQTFLSLQIRLKMFDNHKKLHTSQTC